MNLYQACLKRLQKYHVWGLKIRQHPIYKKNPRIYSLLEVLIVLGNYFLILYYLRFLYWGNYIAVFTCLVALLVFISSFFVHKNTLKELGIRLDNIKSSAKDCALASIVVLTVILILFYFNIEEFRPRTPYKALKFFFNYISWGIFQQFFVLSFLFLRLKDVFKNTLLAVLTTGLLFSLIHSPNMPLVTLTFILGALGTYLFSRHRNILIIGVMHAFFAATIHLMLVPTIIPKSFIIGPQGFHKYDTYGNGAIVASGDINGDGLSEILAGRGPDSGNDTEVFIYDKSGEVIRSFLAYDADTRYGVNIASGDIDGDGICEVITAKGPAYKNDTTIKVFNGSGKEKIRFVAFDRKRFGANVAAGDIDGNGLDEILVSLGPGQNYKPIIRAFDSKGVMICEYEIDDVIKIPNKRPIKIRHGLKIGSGDFDGDGLDEILVGLAPLKDYKAFMTVLDFIPGKSAFVQHTWFMPYSSSGGVNVTSCNIDGNDKDEIITGPGPRKNAGGILKVFSSNGENLLSISLFDVEYGLNVASGDIYGTGRDCVIAAPGPGPENPATIKVFDVKKEEVRLEFTAFQ